jgi:hypothetical protein
VAFVADFFEVERDIAEEIFEDLVEEVLPAFRVLQETALRSMFSKTHTEESVKDQAARFQDRFNHLYWNILLFADGVAKVLHPGMS